MTKAVFARPPFNRRLAPRPLGYHLMLAASTAMGGAAALPAFLGGMPIFHESLADEAVKLHARAMTLDGMDLPQAVLRESQARIEHLTEGITAYHNHPAKRTARPDRVLAGFGTSRLLSHGGRTPAPGVLVVPSLINPSYILDLEPERSFMRYLTSRSFRPALFDWGDPGPEEQDFTLTDYICRRLEPALELMAERTKGPVHLVGYCMGGTLAVALATRRPDLVRSLALLASPWNFHATSVTLIRALSLMLGGTLAQLPSSQPVPIDLLQLFFASLDPTLNDRKFRRFARMDQTSATAHAFVAIEDWANDGMPLARAVAEECLYGWYGNNTPSSGNWHVDGTPVDPQQITCPVLIVAPRADRIVPPESALALADHIPHADSIRAADGHVTMVAGLHAKERLWTPIADWLTTHSQA